AAKAERINRQTETEEEDRAERITKRYDQTFHALTVLSLSQYQAQQQRADRLRHVNRLAQTGQQEQAREDHNNEDFIRRDPKQPVKEWRSPPAEDHETDDEAEGDRTRRGDSGKRACSAQDNSGNERQVNRKENILEHRDAQDQFGFTIGRAPVVEENLGYDRTRGNSSETGNDEHLAKRKAREIAKREAHSEIDSDVKRATG